MKRIRHCGKRIAEFTGELKDKGRKIRRDYGRRIAVLSCDPPGLNRAKALYRCAELAKPLLFRKYEDLIRKELAVPAKEFSGDPETLPCWVFWWQGEEHAPELVRLCMESVRRHAGTHPVVTLDRHNLHEYIEIPDHIMQALQRGDMTLTHFSDIVRCRLLYEYGGIWADATVFCTGPVGNELRELSFYSIRHEDIPYCVPHGRWNCFYMMALPGLPFFHYMNAMFEAYWHDHDYLVCYFLIDLFVAYAYEQDTDTKAMIDRIPIKNTGIRELQKILYEPFDAQRFEQVLAAADLHKLSHKIAAKPSGGRLSTFEYLLAGGGDA